MSVKLADMETWFGRIVRAAAVCSAAYVCGAGLGQQFSAGVNQGNVNTAEITEASGIVGSATNIGVLWTHNDSGDRPRLFAIDVQGQLLGSYELAGFSGIDYEDIDMGPGPESGVSYIYLGDIGDNNANRARVVVYRMPEPAVYLAQHTQPLVRDVRGVEAIELVYPDGPRDAEALMIDPITGDLFIATKQFNAARIYRADAEDLNGSGVVHLVFVRSVSIGLLQLATAADISPTGSEIILKGYGFAKLWRRAEGQSVGDALAAAPVNIPFVSYPVEPQGEAMGFDQWGQDYFSLSEGINQPLYLFSRLSDDGPDILIPLIAAGAEWKYLDDGTDQGAAWRATDFDDSTWAVGAAQLGYGDGDEATVVSDGGDPNDRFITTYFRHSFEWDGSTSIRQLLVRLLYDDGAAVYLNGAPLMRVDLVADAEFDTPASAEREALEDSWQTLAVPSDALRTGENVIAVEVHQFAPTSDDVSFDLQLSARPAIVATLDDFSVLTGTLLDGEVDDLTRSDDSFVHTRSGFGRTFVDLHNMTMIVAARVTVQSGTSIDVSIETRLNHPTGTMQVRMKNWNTGLFDLVGTRAINDVDSVYTMNDVDATNYIETGTGRLDLVIKQIIFVPQFAFLFESWMDWVEMPVN